MLLLIDNFDSFAHNLARYLERLGQQVHVVRNDAVTLAQVRDWQPQAIVLSPGPCTPTEAGCSLDLVREFHDKVPMLGVCLGHQTIAAALGGKVIAAPEPMHGRTSLIEHNGKGIFTGLASPLEVCRYHSLAVEEASLPEALEITARSGEGVIMALQHRTRPIVGMQFHPEAILSTHGYAMLAGFLRIAGIAHRNVEALGTTEYRPAMNDIEDPLPERPVTF